MSGPLLSPFPAITQGHKRWGNRWAAAQATLEVSKGYKHQGGQGQLEPAESIAGIKYLWLLGTDCGPGLCLGLLGLNKHHLCGPHCTVVVHAKAP